MLTILFCIPLGTVEDEKTSDDALYKLSGRLVKQMQRIVTNTNECFTERN